MDGCYNNSDVYFKELSPIVQLDGDYFSPRKYKSAFGGNLDAWKVRECTVTETFPRL